MIERGIFRTEDGERIAYKHLRGESGSGSVAVIAHGFFNSKDSTLLEGLAEEILPLMDVFMFDFRGHGKSGGLYTWTAREGMDLKAALSRMAGVYESTCVVAFSLGASVAINVLAEETFKVSRLVCVSPVCDTAKIDWRPWKIDWKNDVFYSLLSRDGRKGKGARIGPWWLPRPVALERASGLSMPVLYVHGTKDLVVGTWHSLKLAEKTPRSGQPRIIEGGPHAEFLLKDAPGTIPMIKNWIVQE
jgi:pimeloyl-ACP methyl ester carboxylesterase